MGLFGQTFEKVGQDLSIKRERQKFWSDYYKESTQGQSKAQDKPNCNVNMVDERLMVKS